MKNSSKNITDFFEYKWKYFYNLIKSGLKNKTYCEDFLFIAHSGTQDWILGAKARRLSRHFDGKSQVIFSKNFKNIPIAPGYFFLHQKYYAKALRYNPHLKNAKCIVMYTHSDYNKFYSKSHALYTLSTAYKIICLNNTEKDGLIKIGISENKFVVYHMASNPELFQPKEKREGKTVGFCCYYSERKNPELIYNLVMKMPDIKFILIGQNWENYAKMQQLLDFPNFIYYGNKEYSEYPALYKQMDVFVSPSYLEGGPVPLLEAMLCNVVPVASNTGFCPDIISHGKNGYLFDPIGDDDQYVIDLIRKALILEGDMRQYAIMYSWQVYGNKIYNLFHELEN